MTTAPEKLFLATEDAERSGRRLLSTNGHEWTLIIQCDSVHLFAFIRLDSCSFVEKPHLCVLYGKSSSRRDGCRQRLFRKVVGEEGQHSSADRGICVTIQDALTHRLGDLASRVGVVEEVFQFFRYYGLASKGHLFVDRPENTGAASEGAEGGFLQACVEPF